jgi:exopolyphosphatase/guanosine-5'-triphosphate,3'-diphosphate pyrophosphatase
MREQHAIIDIGSNTVRLVVYGGPPRAPAVLLNEKVTAKLGKNVGETGMLSDKAMKIALNALARFAALLQVSGVTDVDTVATAAVRDAGNGAEFLAAVTALGLKPRMLTGAEEALASAHGVMAAFPGATGVVADLGGGSLELMALDSDDCRQGITLPLGTLRLAAARAPGAGKFAASVRGGLRKAGWDEGRGQPLYLVGGAWRALARYAMFRLDWPLDDPHGYELAPEAALSICNTVARGKPLPEMPLMTPSRLASLPDAAALLALLLREIQPSCLIFSSWGLREGLLYRQLDRSTQAQSPMLAGITVFAEAMDVSASTATMVAGWTADVCSGADSGANNGANNGGGSEKLRMAATLMSLAAMRIEPNLRADEAVGWALRKRWIGLDANGRAVLAMATLANNGETAIPADLARLAPLEDLRQAVTWGLAIRLCRKFSGCAARSLSGSALTSANGKLVLTVEEPLHALYSDGVAKNLRLLADWLGLEAGSDLVSGKAKARA